MKKIVLILGLVFVLTIETNCQINHFIECTETEFGISPFGGTKRFTGSFTFEKSPEPLTPVRVNFTLNVTDENQPYSQDDWLIKPGFPHHAASLISDTMSVWPGPHKSGDSYSGSIEFGGV